MKIKPEAEVMEEPQTTIQNECSKTLFFKFLRRIKSAFNVGYLIALLLVIVLPIILIWWLIPAGDNIPIPGTCAPVALFNPMLHMMGQQVQRFRTLPDAMPLLLTFHQSVGRMNTQNALAGVKDHSRPFQMAFNSHKESIGTLYQQTTQAMESFSHIRTSLVSFGLSTTKLLLTVAGNGWLWDDDEFGYIFTNYAESADEISSALLKNGGLFSSVAGQAQLAQRTGVLLLEATVEEAHLRKAEGSAIHAFVGSNSLCWTIAGITQFTPAAAINTLIIPACLINGAENVRRAEELGKSANEIGKVVRDQALKLLDYSQSALQLVQLTRNIMEDFNFRKERSKNLLLDMKSNVDLNVTNDVLDPDFINQARFVACLWDQLIFNLDNPSRENREIEPQSIN